MQGGYGVSKIEAIGRWSAHAALHSALEDTKPEDKVIVLIEYAEGGNGVRTANCSFADAIYMMEQRKFNIFNERGV